VVKICVLLLIAGTLITTLFGHEPADGGQRESLLGAVLVWIGVLGLLSVGVRAVLRTIRRIRNWWIGSG
jgi:hypothetical protein